MDALYITICNCVCFVLGAIVSQLTIGQRTKSTNDEAYADDYVQTDDEKSYAQQWNDLLSYGDKKGGENE